MTSPPVALCWAGVCPTGVLGERILLSRLLKIDFTCLRILSASLYPTWHNSSRVLSLPAFLSRRKTCVFHGTLCFELFCGCSEGCGCTLHSCAQVQ